MILRIEKSSYIGSANLLSWKTCLWRNDILTEVRKKMTGIFSQMIPWNQGKQWLLEGGRRWWCRIFIHHWEVKNSPKEAADQTKTRIAGNVIADTLLCQTESVHHRISRYPDQDSDAMDRLDDCAAVAAFIATNFCDQSDWGNTGSILCRQMETFEMHDGSSWHWHPEGSLCHSCWKVKCYMGHTGWSRTQAAGQSKRRYWILTTLSWRHLSWSHQLKGS